MIISELKAFDLLKSKFKLSDENARAVIFEINAVDRKITEQVEDEFLKRKDVFLTKDDKVELIEKIESQKVKLTEKIENQKSELIEKIENQKVELIEKIENQKSELIEKIEQQAQKIERTRADLIKWMFIFWIGQLAALVGLFKLFIP